MHEVPVAFSFVWYMWSINKWSVCVLFSVLEVVILMKLSSRAKFSW